MIQINISKWNRMQVGPTPKKLCDNLERAFRDQFKTEIDSNLYKVAACLDVAKLHLWYMRQDCE